MPVADSWSRIIRANCTDGPACAAFSGGLEYRMKSAARGRTAVAVDRYHCVGLQCIGHGGSLVDAGANLVVVAARHGGTYPSLSNP